MTLLEYLNIRNEQWKDLPRGEREDAAFQRDTIICAGPAHLNYYDFRTLLLLLLDTDKELWQYATFEGISKITEVKYGLAVAYYGGRPQC